MRATIALGLMALCGATGATLQEVGRLPEHCGPSEFRTPEFGWCGAPPGVHKTLDGGLTWQRVEVPFAPTANARIGFVNPAEGWTYSVGGFGGEELYLTSDGGATWQRRSMPAGCSIVDLAFLTGRIGVALCWLSGHKPGVFRTVDGGSTWNLQSYGNTRTYRDLREGIDSMTFADAEHGLSIELDQILFTRDGGRTWKISRYCANVDTSKFKNPSVGSNMWSDIEARLLDAEYGWWAYQGDLFQTTNGGGTWCKLPPIRYPRPTYGISLLRFTTRSRGWAQLDGYGKMGPPYPIVETLDGGKSWKPFEAMGNLSIYGFAPVAGVVYFWDDQRLYRLVD
jgi:photosystem II stability/assembly factor-like uncharacterized protein